MVLGGFFKSKVAPKTAARPATHLPASRRSEMIDWAVQVYRGKASMARGVLDGALAGFRAKPPHPGDVDALARLLRIHRAERDLRRLMNHREWRYLVLAGIRQLLIDAPPPATERPRRTIVKR
jgi:hypothetical protein